MRENFFITSRTVGAYKQYPLKYNNRDIPNWSNSFAALEDHMYRLTDTNGDII